MGTLYERNRAMVEAITGADVDSSRGTDWSTTGGSADSVNIRESVFDYESLLNPSTNLEDPGGDLTIKPSKLAKQPKP